MMNFTAVNDQNYVVNSVTSPLHLNDTWKIKNET